MDHLFVVIMAGGTGTRFWPLSRRRRPKQFLALGPDRSVPLITAAMRRTESLAPPERTIVVTSASLAEATHAALPELPPENILLEPVGRNTAPCVGWASAFARRRDPEAIVCVVASDAYVEDEEAFLAGLATAITAAQRDSIVTLGIRPTRPEIGYGYIHTGEATETPGVLRVRAFVEKPDLARATEYVLGGHHLWNAGIFVFRAERMLSEIQRLMPDLFDGLTAIDISAASGGEAETVAKVYPSLPNVSIDVGVMENARDVSVVPVECGWNDVGGWQAAWELGEKGATKNVVRSDHERTVLLDTSGSIVVAPPGKTVAVIGIEDLVIVDTEDALLIVPRARAQDVKQAVDALVARKRNDVL